MYHYEANVEWKGEKECTVNARLNPPLRVATPPEFGGPADAWSPLELQVAALTSCYLSTFLNIAGKRALSFQSFSAKGQGVAETTTEGLRFKHMDVAIRIAVADEIMAKKVRATAGALKRLCPVAAALNCPVNLEIDVAVSG